MMQTLEKSTDKRGMCKIVAFSAIINLIVFLLFMCFYTLHYEMPDNLGYSQYIAEGDYTFGQMGYFICAFFGLIQKIIYPFNAFVFMHLFFSFVAFVSVTVVFMCKFNKVFAVLATLLFNAFYAVSHYGNISFTRDPALFCVAGFLLVVHFVNKKEWKIPIAIGTLLVLVGSMYRFRVFEVSVLLVAILVFGQSLTQYFSIEKASRNIKKFFAVLFEKKRLIVAILLVALCYSTQGISYLINTSTPELAYYREYTMIRAKVFDYPIPDYQECKEEYDKINFDANDVEMLRAWYLDDEGAFTLDNLKEIRKIQQNYFSEHRDYVRLVKNMITTELANAKALGDKGVAMFGFGVLVLAFIVVMKKRAYFVPLFLSVVIFGLYIVLWNTERVPPFRGVYMLWVSAQAYMLYSFSLSDAKPFFVKLLNEKRKVTTAIISVAVTLTSALGFYLSIASNYTLPSYSNVDTSVELKEYFEENKDKKFELSRATGLTDTNNNVLYITETVYKDNQSYFFNNTYYRYENYERHMREFGTDNMYSNLLNDNVYFVCNTENDHSKIMNTYLNKYYGNSDNISYTAVDSFKNYVIYKFAKE